MIYCDTSLLVALLTSEAHSAAAERWFRVQAQDELVASAWVVTEVASALALKRRMDVLDQPAHAAAVRAAARLFGGLNEATIERRHFHAAAERFVFAGSGGLRSGDALHLAIASDHGFLMATLDGALREAAIALGIEAPNIRAS